MFRRETATSMSQSASVTKQRRMPLHARAKTSKPDSWEQHYCPYFIAFYLYCCAQVQRIDSACYRSYSRLAMAVVIAANKRRIQVECCTLQAHYYIHGNI